MNEFERDSEAMRWLAASARGQGMVFEIRGVMRGLAVSITQRKVDGTETVVVANDLQQCVDQLREAEVAS